MDLPVAVIVPVYNAIRSLELVLTGYCRQTFQDFALWIADDGSAPELRTFVDDFSRGAPFRIQYVFQPDEGYRKCHILNQAISASSAPYLIFADADCIPHSDFVRAHYERRKPRTVLCGRRVQLNARYSQSLTARHVRAGKLERLTPRRILLAFLQRDSRWDEGFLWRNRTLHGWFNRKEPSLLGSNFSLDKSLLEEINGFNEDFVGYSGEDTEIEWRLRLAGARFQWVRHLAVQYHLYHPVRPRSSTNQAALELTRAQGRAACRNGLRKLPLSDP